MIFSRIHILIISQLFLILTLITSASAKGGKPKPKPKPKPKGGKDNPIKSCVYQIPDDFANDPVATASKYTVTVTSGTTVSTPVYDGCCFLENPPKECPPEKCEGACTVTPEDGKKSSAQRGVENSERVWESGFLAAVMFSLL
ncbi:uncharacterized protein EAE98_010518 [Botrytis deweyae]|uniref:Uncharacterized protein n=2 Tax=Botrytis TaxID=33196 RepID=A0A4Z1JTH3_9HELO|nr:uncharacterized protein EAE98_010518 [Botrytis deweyae]KAF7916114.1 hypothetical protein EAE99_009867 [Botrytis elliptica]KAF7916796.1 hypothetical protein EAE98_010518 [Botrytis deweyae]TGO76898.1 hypothetical protein BELL_0132g00150 [Botrytis elliptica]